MSENGTKKVCETVGCGKYVMPDGTYCIDCAFEKSLPKMFDQLEDIIEETAS